MSIRVPALPEADSIELQIKAKGENFSIAIGSGEAVDLVLRLCGRSEPCTPFGTN